MSTSTLSADKESDPSAYVSMKPQITFWNFESRYYYRSAVGGRTYLPQYRSRSPAMLTSDENRCGQFTFYFSKCGHATSHKYHRAPDSGPDCNSNCIYDRKIDYWFWAGKDKRCSFCGLGQEHGFGTQHPIPEDEGLRMILFEKVKEGMILSEPDDVYNAQFDEAAEWYNRKAMEAIALADDRAKAQNPSPGKLRTQRRLRHENRREIRRLRAKRRTERWVQNVRDEQYTAMKGNVEVGKQPFIIGDVGNPYMDLFSEASLTSLTPPIDNCALCQYPLDDVRDCGNPHSLPCGHKFHLRCLEEIFDRRAAGEEKEIHKCPLCKVWFRDLREFQTFTVDFVATSKILTAMHRARNFRILTLERQRAMHRRLGSSDRKHCIVFSSCSSAIPVQEVAVD